MLKLRLKRTSMELQSRRIACKLSRLMVDTLVVVTGAWRLTSWASSGYCSDSDDEEDTKAGIA